MKFAERLYDAFGDEVIGWEAAKALGEIASPDPILTKANHAEVKVIKYSHLSWISDNRFLFITQVLYVQKYVSTVLPRLIASAKHSQSKATMYLNVGEISNRRARRLRADSVSCSLELCHQVHPTSSLCPRNAYSELCASPHSMISNVHVVLVN